MREAWGGSRTERRPPRRPVGPPRVGSGDAAAPGPRRQSSRSLGPADVHV